MSGAQNRQETLAASRLWVPIGERTAGFWLPALLVGALGLMYALAMDWTVTGYDDATYLEIARSLASGSGYRLGGGAAPWATTPLLPLMLAPLWRLGPALPEGIAWFKLVPIACALLSIPVLWMYFIHARRVAAPVTAAIILLALLAPPTFTLTAQQVMSEVPYLLFSSVTLYLGYEALVKGSRSKKLWLGLGAGLAAALLTRTVGLTLVAGCLGFLLWKRQWRASVVLMLLLGALLAPWQLYLHSQNDLLLAPSQYQSDFMLREYGHPELGMITSYWEIPPRIVANLYEIVNDSLPRLFLPVLTGDRLLPALARLGLDWIRPGVGLVLAGGMALGWGKAIKRGMTPLEWYTPLYLGMILLPPWSIPRNLVPIAPFLLYYLWLGLETTSAAASSRRPNLKRPAQAAFVLVFAGMLISVGASDRHLIKEGLDAPAGQFAAWDQSYYEAGDWLKGHTWASATIATPIPKKMEFYLDRPVEGLPAIGGQPAWNNTGQGLTDYVVLQPGRPTEEYDGEHPLSVEAFTGEYGTKCQRVFTSHAVPYAYVYACQGK